ncbi:MAG: cytochrome c biogenesis protein CcdA [Aeromicrobium erythreum]
MLLAAPIAVAAGLLSFFSPCVLPLLPGYLSYVTGVGVQDLEAARRGRLVAGAALFVLGFTVVFVAGGSLFGALGAQLQDHRRAFSVVMGLVVIVLGLVFAGVAGPWQREVKVHAVPAVGLGVAPLLGALFGLGWVPCVSPTLGAVLTLAGTEGTAGRGALLSVFYSLGLGVPFLVAAVALARFAAPLAWVRRHQRAFMIGGGVLLVAVGVLLVTGWWDAIVTDLQSSVGTGEIAL